MTLIVVGESFEAVVLRAVLEIFNFRVTTHWTGSRKEFLMLLSGDIPINDDLLVISCHGTVAGIDVPGEEPVSPQEISQTAKLPDKIVTNLGCKTGNRAFQDAFKHAGVKYYIAPDDYPEGMAAIVFATNLFYLIKNGKPLRVAAKQAANIDEETSQFKLA